MAMQMRRVGGHGSMLETLIVSANLSVVQGCPIHASVHERDTVTFTFGADGEPADLTLDAESLRNLLDLGHRALNHMNTWPDDNNTKPIRLKAGTP